MSDSLQSNAKPQPFGCGFLLIQTVFCVAVIQWLCRDNLRHGRRKMQIRCNLLRAADSYRQNIEMGEARMDTFGVIFTTYSPLVFRYLRSLSGDAAVAEELTAETFYRNTIRCA